MSNIHTYVTIRLMSNIHAYVTVRLMSNIHLNMFLNSTSLCLSYLAICLWLFEDGGSFRW